MTWHDCQVHSIALDQEGEWQSDLVLELDFIVEWLSGPDKRCRFRVAPAVLPFMNVDNLRLDLSLKFKQPLKIFAVDRTGIPTTGYTNYHWTIKVQHYPDLKKNAIELDAPGFTQELISRPIETESQNMTEAARKKSKDGWRTSA